MTSGVVVGGSVFIAGWQSLGMAILAESFRWAAVGITQGTTSRESSRRVVEARQFVYQGTALEAALDLFGLSFTGEEARGIFESWLRRRTTPYSRS